VSRQRVDWTARDKELAQEVIAACINIVAKNHGKKIKLWQIYQSVPCLKAKLAHLDRLPLTLKTIENAMKKFQNNLQFQ
jgi:hypothetical protein